MNFHTIDIIPDGPTLYIISQLKMKDLCHVAQVSRRLNKLIEQHREHLYASEDFDTLRTKKDIIGIRWLAIHHPERKCSSQVFDQASKKGHTEIVKLLLAADKPYTYRALNYASANGHIEIVKLLLVANKPCSYWPLIFASNNGYIKIVKLLLEGNKYSTKQALHRASYNGHTEIVKLLHDFKNSYRSREKADLLTSQKAGLSLDIWCL